MTAKQRCIPYVVIVGAVTVVGAIVLLCGPFLSKGTVESGWHLPTSYVNIRLEAVVSDSEKFVLRNLDALCQHTKRSFVATFLFTR